MLDRQQEDRTTIFRAADGTFEMKGYAALDDVCAALDIDAELVEEGNLQ